MGFMNSARASLKLALENFKGDIVLQLISLVIALAIGFAGGYGLRELKSRHRRAIAREEHFRRQQQKIYNSTA